MIQQIRATSLFVEERIICLLWLLFLGCLQPSIPAFGADLVPVPDLGLRIAPGFRISLYADSDLANDIYAMTLDANGRVVVTSQGYIKTLLDTNNDGRADQFRLFGTTQTGGMGMCFDGNDLYFMGDGFFSVYHDRDGNGEADGPPEKILPLHFAEHGGHAVRKGPDGWWYLIGGNDTGFNSSNHITLATSPVRAVEAGALLRISPIGRDCEVIAHGLRNPYDFDFNWVGDIFTYDSDVESDLFLPWYTPTRVYQIAYGGHHGWRLTASAKLEPSRLLCRCRADPGADGPWFTDGCSLLSPSAIPGTLPERSFRSGLDLRQDLFPSDQSGWSKLSRATRALSRVNRNTGLCSDRCRGGAGWFSLCLDWRPENAGRGLSN